MAKANETSRLLAKSSSSFSNDVEPGRQNTNNNINGGTTTGTTAVSQLAPTSSSFPKRIFLWGENLCQDFSQFVSKGNVVDLAVGLVVGKAFSAIVNSFVEDLFTPIIGLIISTKLSEAFLTIKQGKNPPYLTREEAQKDGAVTWNYGNFIQTSVNFFYISLSMFIVLRILQALERKRVKYENDIIRNRSEVSERVKKVEEKVKEEEKKCEYCFTDIHISAKKCPNCCSSL